MINNNKGERGKGKVEKGKAVGLSGEYSDKRNKKTKDLSKK